jgi:hypothetical protein
MMRVARLALADRTQSRRLSKLMPFNVAEVLIAGLGRIWKERVTETKRKGSGNLYLEGEPRGCEALLPV